MHVLGFQVLSHTKFIETNICRSIQQSFYDEIRIKKYVGPKFYPNNFELS